MIYQKQFVALPTKTANPYTEPVTVHLLNRFIQSLVSVKCVRLIHKFGQNHGMKKVLFLVLLTSFLNASAQSSTGAAVTWEKPTHDFGDLTQGDKVEHTFKFTNTGTEPLVITNVQVTCGCTTPRGWARDPIPPGAESEITIGFNSTGKFGRQKKVVTIVSNAINQDGTQIIFFANVLAKVPN